jgi:NitT/TauT family transport system substrate-binding protein
MPVKNTCRFTVLIVLIILFATFTGACVSPAPPTPPGTPAPLMTSVKVAYMPIISFGPLYIAEEEGYFARQGITVEFEKFPSTAAALPALITGDIAVTGGQVSPGLINVIADGAPVRIVADKGIILPDSCTSQAILVRRDLIDSGSVKTVSDLRGRKVAAGTDQSYGVFRALALGNLTTSDIEFVTMPREGILVAFENGAVDAAFLMEPYVTEAVRNNKSVVFLTGYAITPYYSNSLLYGTAFTQTDPELGRRFMVAYLEGVRQYNRGKTERNLQILSKYTRLDRNVLNETCWVDIAETGEFPPEPILEYVDWMYMNKKIPRTVENNQLFDMSYVQHANSILGNVTVNRSQNF